MIDCYKSLGQENSKKRFLLIFLAGFLFIACSKVNDISKKDIKYTVINKVVPKEHASVGKFNSTVWITIPSDISKDEIEKLILPKVYEDNIENYDSLSVFMYSDKRFYESGSDATHGFIEFYKNGEIKIKDIKTHKYIPTEREISIYTENLKMLNSRKQGSSIEEIEKIVEKKYNISEEELNEINEKIFMYTLDNDFK